MRYLLTVAYDGSHYYGWQRQKNFITVQQCLEESLSELLKQTISVRGSSRTDTGVHALGQRAVFEAESSIPPEKMPFAANAFLPDDIVVRGCTEVSTDFHPQNSVYKKTYVYRILNDTFPDPMLRNYTEFVHTKLDVDKMNKACEYFLGEHDFAAFCASGSTAKTTVRTIFDLKAEKRDNIIYITVTGSGFLYNMVRIITGTLIAVGQNKLSPYDIKQIILSKDRTKAGMTVSPNGLLLKEIYYKT